MTASIDPTSGGVVPPAAVDAATAAQSPAVASGQASAAAIQISSMEDLKAKAPEVYNALLQGMASSMMSSEQRHLERFKKLQREMNDRDG